MLLEIMSEFRVILTLKLWYMNNLMNPCVKWNIHWSLIAKVYFRVSNWPSPKCLKHQRWHKSGLNTFRFQQKKFQLVSKFKPRKGHASLQQVKTVVVVLAISTAIKVVMQKNLIHSVESATFNNASSFVVNNSTNTVLCNKQIVSVETSLMNKLHWSNLNLAKYALFIHLWCVVLNKPGVFTKGFQFKLVPILKIP